MRRRAQALSNAWKRRVDHLERVGERPSPWLPLRQPRQDGAAGGVGQGGEGQVEALRGLHYVIPSTYWYLQGESGQSRLSAYFPVRGRARIGREGRVRKVLRASLKNRYGWNRLAAASPPFNARRLPSGPTIPSEDTMQRLRCPVRTELAFTTQAASSPACCCCTGRELIADVSRTRVRAGAGRPCHRARLARPRRVRCTAAVTFPAIGEAICELLDRLGVGPSFIYLHDWGTPVGLHVAMRAPEQVLGLIVQNANAHRTGWGPGWAATKKLGRIPPRKTKRRPPRTDLAGTRDTYLSGVRPPWPSGSRRTLGRGLGAMNLPGNGPTAVLIWIRQLPARFDAIADTSSDGSPLLMVWGRPTLFRVDECCPV